jgi:asparagine synthase (glutamine-hydrolysing)
MDHVRIAALLEESLLRRLPQDRSQPVGVYLSGGLDSALVAALCVRSGVPTLAFTLDFGPPWDVEVPWAQLVAEHLGIECRLVDARPKQVARAVEPAAAALPEPFGDPVIPGLWLLGEAAKDHVGLVLNGEGGDQLFGGWANKPLVAAQAYGLVDFESEYLHTYHRFLGLGDRLYTPEFAKMVDHVDPRDWVRDALVAPAHTGLLHRLRGANLALKGFQNIAPRCAALASCHGLKVETPFFDSALTEATFALSEVAFLDGSVEKPILKEIARQWLPDSVVDRPKRGMGAPASAWLSRDSPVGALCRVRLSRWALRREGRFQPELVEDLIRGSDPSPEGFRERRAAEKMWTLFHWEIWRTVHGLD